MQGVFFLPSFLPFLIPPLSPSFMLRTFLSMEALARKRRAFIKPHGHSTFTGQVMDECSRLKSPADMTHLLVKKVALMHSLFVNLGVMPQASGCFCLFAEFIYASFGVVLVAERIP
jgi:hypothetical protein